MNNVQAITIWFTGLSASGKSTLSEGLYNDLQELGVTNVELLDGESVRDMLKNNSFDKSNREKIGIQKARIALELNKQGKIVLVSGIAHKKRWRKDIRKMIDNYFEVYLDCDVKECSKRDYKGNYDKAFSGKLENFIGVSEQYEGSDEYDLVLHTGRDSIETCSSLLLEKIKQTINI
jgi:adenylylsulfate kinase-like enzyme